MIKVIMHGCGGKMGHVVSDIIEKDSICEIVAGIDARKTELKYTTFTNLDECNIKGDVIIDFSTADAIPLLLEYSKRTKTPLVLCTTGLTEDMLNKVKEYSKHTAILKSANMSIGINLISSLVQKAVQILSDSNFDIEILEKHHNQKIDAPSGTAIAIADAINEVMENSYKYVYDRSQTREKRTKNEIGIHALRGGTIVGEHDVIFAGQDEIIEINHKAMSKEIFAVGAVKAAKFLAGKTSGFYSMKDVMGSL